MRTVPSTLTSYAVSYTHLRAHETEEFSLVRFDGDADRAAAVYAGVEALTADDVADVIGWVASRPAHVNVDLVQVTPQQQAAVHKVVRRT